MGILGIYVRTSIETDGTSIEQKKKKESSFVKKTNLSISFMKTKERADSRLKMMKIHLRIVRD
jgi:hypothetical protein